VIWAIVVVAAAWLALGAVILWECRRPWPEERGRGEG